MQPIRNERDGVEQAAEFVISFLFSVFRIIGTLLHVLWLIAHASYRTVELYNAGANGRSIREVFGQGNGCDGSARGPFTSRQTARRASGACGHSACQAAANVTEGTNAYADTTPIATPAPAPAPAPAVAQDAAPADVPANDEVPPYLPVNAPNGVPMNIHIVANEIYDVDDNSGAAWYAIIRGRRVGVVQTWARAGAFVIGVPNNLVQRFDTRAQAVEAYHIARRAGNVRVLP